MSSNHLKYIIWSDFKASEYFRIDWKSFPYILLRKNSPSILIFFKLPIIVFISFFFALRKIIVLVVYEYIFAHVL